MQIQEDVRLKKGRKENIKNVLSFFKKIRQRSPFFDGTKSIRTMRDGLNVVKWGYEGKFI